MAYVYILKLNKGSYYVGSCRKLEQRLNDHKNGDVKSTKYKLPFSLIYAREHLNYSGAKKEELKIKSWKKRKSIENLCKFDKDNIVSKHGPIV